MQPPHDPSTTWNLDRLMDDMAITTETKHSSVHVVTPGNLSHHSSIASSASSASTHSRRSTFSIPKPVSPVQSQPIRRIPVTQYQVPNAYDNDDNDNCCNQPQQPQPTRAERRQRHFSVASFGMASTCAQLFFGDPSCQHLYDVEWSGGGQNNSSSTLLTLMQFPPAASAERSKTELMALGHRLGVTAFLIYVNMSDFNALYTSLDALLGCIPSSPWLRHVLFVFDQINTPTARMEQESRHVLEHAIPQIRARYRLDKEPGAVFVTSAPGVVRHPHYGASYRSQCKQVLWEAIDKMHRELGRWRPHHDGSDDDSDDDDDDDDHRLLRQLRH